MLKSGSHYEVLVIGTGFSGLCAAIKLKDRGLEDFVVVDKASGIGGTWLANRYPGAACDVPSQSFEHTKIKCSEALEACRTRVLKKFSFNWLRSL